QPENCTDWSRRSSQPRAPPKPKQQWSTEPTFRGGGRAGKSACRSPTKWPRSKKTNESERPPRRNRRLLAAAAGADIKPLLEPLAIRGLVHDGNMDLSASANRMGQCRWHVPYTVRYLLYKD